MSPTQEEYVVDFADIRFVSLVCGHCKYEAIVDASSASEPVIAEACPRCDKAFEPESLRSNFAALRSLIRSAHASEETTEITRIRIRVAK
jgi:hypothetical protein